MMTRAARASFPSRCLPCPIMALGTDRVLPVDIRHAIAATDQADSAYLLERYHGWRVARGEPTKLERQLENWHALEIMVCERPLDLRPKRFARAWDIGVRLPKRTDGAVESSTSRTPIAPTDRTKIVW